MMLQITYIVLSLAIQTYAVNRPPHIYMQPVNKDIYFIHGQSIEVTCLADGIPKPTYRWKRNGIDYDPSSHGDRIVQLVNQGTIVFNRPEDIDEGIYQCSADNGYGISVSIKINFRMAELSNFSYNDRFIHRAYYGDSLTLNCLPPRSIPYADISWVLQKPDGRWEAINFDRRVSMDLEGRLIFTNVKPSDAQGGNAYACMAVNNVLGANVIGPEHEVDVIGTTDQMRPAYELWTSPSDQIFLRGNMLRLKCIFGGNPTPDVQWEKLNGQMSPDRHRITSFGQELQILNLELSDAGQYQCTGFNNYTEQKPAKGFEVRIESEPYWIDEPKNVEASVNEKATFICRADGVPTPTYIWYINGVQLENVRDPRIYNNVRFHKSSENIITLSNLTLDDHMNIQCNATNRHGYVFADAYLNIVGGDGAAQNAISLSLLLSIFLNCVFIILY